jgi:hypothetical protein
VRRARKLVSVVALAGIAALALIGCGQLPTAPHGAEPASATKSIARPAVAPVTIRSTVDDVLGLIVQTLDLTGSLGGSLANGRWSVSIPAGAVDGDVVVRLGVSSPTSSDCQLEMWPADKNHFLVPATLTVDCRGISRLLLANYVIFWHDPATGRWVPVPGSKVDLVAGTVSAPLQHFSQYAVGTKAGW